MTVRDKVRKGDHVYVALANGLIRTQGTVTYISPVGTAGGTVAIELDGGHGAKLIISQRELYNTCCTLGKQPSAEDTR